MRDYLVVYRVLARGALVGRRVLIYASARRGDGLLSAVLTQARLQGVPDLVLLGHRQLDLVLYSDAERLDRRLTHGGSEKESEEKEA